MVGEFGFRPKGMDELESQFAGANTILDSKKELLRPPSVDREKILSMPEAEIKEKFPRRYEMYYRLVKELRYRENNEEAEGLVTLNESEIEHMRKWLIALNSLDEYIQNHYENEEERTLRGRQINVFEDLRNFLEQGGTAGYVKLPTGVGKTVLFTELIEALDLKTLIVVPTKILVKQTHQKIKQFAPDLDVGKVYQHAKEYGRQITITTYNSLIAKVESGEIKPEDFDCLILDEAHHALAKGSKGAIGKFTEAVKLGFTATPDFKFEKRLAHLLPKEIHSMTIREAVEENLLCGVSSVIAKTDTDISNVPIDDTGEYSEEQLEKAVNIASRNKAAVQLYKTTYDGQPASAFCVNVEHARIVTKEFNEAGIPAAMITGETPKEEQEQILKDWHEGKIKVVSCAKLFIEGLDEKRVSVCLNLKPTRSRISAEQRGGRVLRLDEDNPKKHATVIDFLDKGIPEDKPPILFADVVDIAVLVPKLKGGGPGGRPTQPVILDIAGLEVIYDEEEIMRIVQQFRNTSESPDNKIIHRELIKDLEKLKLVVREAGVSSFSEYRTFLEDHPDWPSHPDLYYINWISWYDFLGKEDNRREKKDKVKTLTELKKSVKEAGIKSRDKYSAALKDHPDWPTYPSKEYPDWKDWYDFFDKVAGKEKVKKITTLQLLKKAVAEANVNNKTEYVAALKDHPDWPTHPDRVYSDWINWLSFSGRERVEKIKTLKEFKKSLKESVVDSYEKFKKIRPSRSDWPAAPEQFYSDWTNWSDVWGGT